jgi:hypothetical protein
VKAYPGLSTEIGRPYYFYLSKFSEQCLSCNARDGSGGKKTTFGKLKNWAKRDTL